MGRRFYRISFFFLGLIFLDESSCFAFTATLTSGGDPVHWPDGFKFNLAGNSRNSSGLSDNDIYNSVTKSLQRWKAASGGAMGFDYWQGTDPAVYEPDSNYNGLSSLYFASNARGSTGLTSNILGLTQVWYDTKSGQIVEADTVLNDLNFIFTTQPTDTSGFGSSSSTYGAKNRVFIENVLTHEFGHSLGFSHSGQMQSTMLFMESPEQAHLGCDEQIAIHGLYPTSDVGSRSSIVGAVLGPTGMPLFGANVQAISRRRGTVLSSSLTDRAGHYVISGLEPGEYFLLAEPYYPGSQPLPAYYSGMSSALCPNGDSFGRTVLVNTDGFTASLVQAQAGVSVTAPTFSVSCNSGGAAIRGLVASAVQSSAPLVFDGLKNSGFGFTDLFPGVSGAHFYKLSQISGHLEVRVLSYSLYSPIAMTVQLLDPRGNPVSSAQTQVPVYTGDSGYSNYDVLISADQLPLGDYYLSASPTSLSALLYPAGSVALDSVHFTLVTGTLNEPDPALSAVLPFNARCRMAENFSSYQSPAGSPPRNSVSSSDNTGGCGMMDTSGGRRGGKGGGQGPPPSGSAVLGWFMPWLMMFLIARLARRPIRI